MNRLPLVEGQSLGKELLARQTPARLSGGVGIALRCPSIARVAPDRQYHDVDLCVASGATKGVDRLLIDLGYEPATRFNALNAGRQLMYDAPERDMHIDIFIDRLRMCHVLDFRKSLTCSDASLPATDLLLSKLQIVQLTEKDLLDLFALLIDSPVSEDGADQDRIDVHQMARLCGQDWGWYTTVQKTLEKVIDGASARLSDSDRDIVVDQANLIAAALQRTPKSIRWKTRSRLGERVKWYELPEDPNE